MNTQDFKKVGDSLKVQGFSAILYHPEIGCGIVVDSLSSKLVLLHQAEIEKEYLKIRIKASASEHFNKDYEVSNVVKEKPLYYTG